MWEGMLGAKLPGSCKYNHKCLCFYYRDIEDVLKFRYLSQPHRDKSHLPRWSKAETHYHQSLLSYMHVM